MKDIVMYLMLFCLGVTMVMGTITLTLMFISTIKDTINEMKRCKR